MTPRIEAVECWVLRAPIDEPVANAFGAMTNRPAVFLRIGASDGAWGWGEVFANFPQVGAEHRARLVDSMFAPLLAGADADDPAPVRAMLERRTRQMAIQCGEPGPFAQIVGAVDQALFDMAARRAGRAVVEALRRPAARARVRERNRPRPRREVALAKRAEGFRAFKLKVGFGADARRRQPRALREALGDDATIMCDANQAWTAEEASARIAELAPFRPHWIEEPIGADQPHRGVECACARKRGAARRRRKPARARTRSPMRSTQAISRSCSRTSANGAASAAAGRGAACGVARTSRTVRIGSRAAWGSRRRCTRSRRPARAQGYAEVDANPNPLREDVFPLVVDDGWVTLSDRPGLGVEPDLARLARLVVWPAR